MSSHSYSQNCPKCNCVDSLMVNENTRPYNSVSAECVECGFSYWTEKGQMELEELNEVREMYDLEELIELPKVD